MSGLFACPYCNSVSEKLGDIKHDPACLGGIIKDLCAKLTASESRVAQILDWLKISPLRWKPAGAFVDASVREVCLEIERQVKALEAERDQARAERDEARARFEESKDADLIVRMRHCDSRIQKFVISEKRLRAERDEAAKLSIDYAKESEVSDLKGKLDAEKTEMLKAGMIAIDYAKESGELAAQVATMREVGQKLVDAIKSHGLITASRPGATGKWTDYVSASECEAVEIFESLNPAEAGKP